MMDPILKSTYPGFRIQSWKRVPLVGQGVGFTSERDGYHVADLEIVVDVPALVKLIGYKAIRSKKHVTKLQAGAIIVRAVNIRKEP